MIHLEEALVDDDGRPVGRVEMWPRRKADNKVYMFGRVVCNSKVLDEVEGDDIIEVLGQLNSNARDRHNRAALEEVGWFIQNGGK